MGAHGFYRALNLLDESRKSNNVFHKTGIHAIAFLSRWTHPRQRRHGVREVRQGIV
jgi:hypothetical protein